MRPALTSRQKAILEYIVEMVRTRGYPPTLWQIGKRFGISSTNGVRAHLKALEKKGYLRRQARTSRGIELLIPVVPVAFEGGVEVPVVGRVAAGQPLLAVENIERTLVLDKDLVKGEGCFALKVIGESMIEDGIFDGDYVLVRPQPIASDGDIVVALLEDEATVKRFFREKDRVRLQPANSRMEPVFSRDVQIIGKVFALIRPRLS